MEFTLESFVENPTWEALNSCKKTDLLQVARQYGISVAAGSRKDTVKKAVVNGLLKK